MNSHVITPGPYRATKLWNEVTRLFRSGMPLKKHRQNFRHHASCFTASAAVDWLHQLLRSNSNFGPDVTRQQTVQLLKKFLKNHVIEDVKGRWGTEDLEDSNSLYRFPSTSPQKPIPRLAPASSSIRKRPSLRDKDGFFRFRSLKKLEKETQENVDPALQTGEENHPAGEQQMQRRELTVEDEQDIWRDITLTHLQRIMGLASLEEVLNQRSVNPHNIIHNMTKVNKHGVVTLDDKTNDLPHWVLSAMKSLANWPKYDSAQPSYPGFERDVFKTVSDYFYSLPQPLLTYELYELFINVLVFCGYVAAPPTYQRGKRKKSDLPSVPPPAKASFRSTECLLLSLLRQGTCDEGESPMTDVLGGTLQSRMAALKGGGAGDTQFGGSCTSLSTFVSTRPQTRSCSLETILSDSAPLTRQQLFLSNESLASCTLSRSHSDSSAITTPQSDFTPVTKATPVTREPAAGVRARNRLSVAQRLHPLRPRSVGSCLDIVIETREEEDKETKWQSRAASCFNVNAPTDPQHFSAASRPSSSSYHPSYHPSSSSFHPFSSLSSTAVARAQEAHATAGPGRPRPASSTSNLWMPPAPAVVRRCLSSLDVSKPPRPVALFKRPVCVPASSSHPPQPKPEHSLLQSHCERVAIEALQLCTLLLPPTSRRKLQLLMRMMSRISQNVDMPQLHPAIGTRTLMVHTFSGCVLGSAEECDLDELLATRLVSFLLDHQQSILSVPDYLLSAISDHVQYLRTAQVPIDTGFNVDSSDVVSIAVPVFAFCRQISGAEFEQQKQASSRKAMEDLLEILLTDQNISEKDRRKKLKQFQKQYPDIYSHRCPASDRENKTDNKPKIKPALLNIKKTKAFSIRN
ncbi:DEP domain-containing protein 1A isoform X1 [Hippoglossus stenolepis]|uniref:DEP domain-containing protein 1A isoform X1 n=1 Tax=Hippoglossus stenolepis TaxID=195615 RepID=UPI001FAEA016|nr:DEP domain-containing protein 1A isoform X1 [Hippoglossus stenolepis]